MFGKIAPNFETRSDTVYIRKLMLYKILSSFLILDIVSLVNVVSSTNNNTGGIFVLRNTTYGQVLGKLIQTENFKAEVFLGVPYAKSPLNELRFEYPTEPETWTKQKMCTEYKPWCIQFLVTSEIQSEDCLYLNIIVPYKTKPKSLLYPVLVWLHGGSYYGDGANMFPIEGTINNIVSENVVTVFVNYRVGPFGYISLVNNTLPGNYGLEDQLFALKWIQKNIHHFDGDAKRITLAGESAGAASASLLAVSPKANGLFQHLMLRSGSGLAPWALNVDRTKANSEFVLSKLGCSNMDSTDIKECLKNCSIEEIKRSWYSISRDINLMFDIGKRDSRRLPLNHVILTIMTPVIDGYRLNDSILPDSPRNLFPHSASRSLIIVAQQSMDDEDEIEFDVTPKHTREFPYFDENNTIVDWEAMVPKSMFINPDFVYQAIEMNYFKNVDQMNRTDKLKQFTKVMSDSMVVAPVLLEAEIYAKAGMPVYLYQFDYKHPLLSSKLPECVDTKIYRDDSQHGLDIVFLFQSASVLGFDIELTNWTSNDLSITKLLSEQVTNFVKTGNPNSLEGDRLMWPRYSSATPLALYIQSEIQRLVDVDDSMFNFWYETVQIVNQLKACL